MTKPKIITLCVKNLFRSKALQAVARSYGFRIASAGTEVNPYVEGYPGEAWLDEKWGKLDKKSFLWVVDTLEQNRYGNFQDIAEKVRHGNLNAIEMTNLFHQVVYRESLVGVDPSLREELQARGLYHPSLERVTQFNDYLAKKYDVIIGMSSDLPKDIQDLYPSSRGKVVSYEEMFEIEKGSIPGGLDTNREKAKTLVNVVQVREEVFKDAFKQIGVR